MTWIINIAILANLVILSGAKNLLKIPRLMPQDNKQIWRGMFWVAVALVVAYLTWLTREQFILWKNHPVSQFLLPPYNDIGYFVFYSATRIWAPHAASWLIGLLAYWLTSLLNKWRGGQIFYNEELYFIWLGLFLSGHPGWIVYVILVLTIGLLLTAYCLLLNKETQRVSLYYLWLPAGIAAILLNLWLLNNWTPYLKLLL